MGVQYGEAIQMGGNGRKPMMYQTLAEGLVQKKVKEILGLNECKFAFTGAAPISVETLRYFASVGIHINEVYGMSECTGACTWSTDKAHIWGSVGWAIPGVEVKVFKVEGGTYLHPTLILLNIFSHSRFLLITHSCLLSHSCLSTGKAATWSVRTPRICSLALRRSKARSATAAATS